MEVNIMIVWMNCTLYQAACWSPDGKILVFAVADEPALYSLQFQNVGK